MILLVLFFVERPSELACAFKKKMPDHFSTLRRVIFLSEQSRRSFADISTFVVLYVLWVGREA